MSALLEIRNVTVAYGGIQAVRDLSLDVAEGEMVCLIGANGAGKTTTLKAISGLLAPGSGTFRFDGHAITGQAAHAIARQGLALVPEGRGIFPRMSVAENLLMGAYTRHDAAAVRRDNERIYELLPRLSERRHQIAFRVVSGGACKARHTACNCAAGGPPCCRRTATAGSQACAIVSSAVPWR